jgi:hypothetical protein
MSIQMRGRDAKPGPFGYEAAVELRRPLRVLYGLGLLGWPLGVFAFGGFDDDTGAAIVVAGCFLALGSMSLELVLRRRDRGRITTSAGTDQSGAD